MKHAFGDTGRFLNEEYHDTRWKAISTTFTIDEWGDIDQTKFDLDNLQFSRRFKDSSYITEPRIESEGTPKAGVDVRQVDPTID